LIRRGASTFGFSIDAAARRRLPRIAAAALAMAGLLWLAMRLAAASGSNGLAQAILLVILIVAGIAVYGLFLRLFGVTGWREAVERVQANEACRLARLGLAWQTTPPNRQFRGKLTMAFVERVFSGRPADR